MSPRNMPREPARQQQTDGDVRPAQVRDNRLRRDVVEAEVGQKQREDGGAERAQTMPARIDQRGAFIAKIVPAMRRLPDPI